MPFIKNLKSTAKLSYKDGEIMDMLIKEFEMVRFQRGISPIACEGFYEGCGCDLCEANERLGSHNYPKVGDSIL